MDIIVISSVPRKSNIIDFHVRYIRKIDRLVKAIILLWGNHDIDRFELCTDAP